MKEHDHARLSLKDCVGLPTYAPKEIRNLSRKQKKRRGP
jgi:hypothetical protein